MSQEKLKMKTNEVEVVAEDFLDQVNDLQIKYIQALEFIQAIEKYIIAKDGPEGMMEFTKEVARFQLEHELLEKGCDESEVEKILEDVFSVDVTDMFQA